MYDPDNNTAGGSNVIKQGGNVSSKLPGRDSTGGNTSQGTGVTSVNVDSVRSARPSTGGTGEAVKGYDETGSIGKAVVGGARSKGLIK